MHLAIVNMLTGVPGQLSLAILSFYMRNEYQAKVKGDPLHWRVKTGMARVWRQCVIPCKTCDTWALIIKPIQIYFSWQALTSRWLHRLKQVVKMHVNWRSSGTWTYTGVKLGDPAKSQPPPQLSDPPPAISDPPPWNTDPALSVVIHQCQARDSGRLVNPTSVLNSRQRSSSRCMRPRALSHLFLFDAFVIWYFKEWSIMRMHA